MLQVFSGSCEKVLDYLLVIQILPRCQVIFFKQVRQPIQRIGIIRVYLLDAVYEKGRRLESYVPYRTEHGEKQLRIVSSYLREQGTLSGAAEVLGYTKAQTFLRIILPQVMKRIIPSVTNEVVTLVKDTSMAFTVSYQEMFTIGKQIANSQTSFLPFLVAGLFYYVFNLLVDFTMGSFEKRMGYYR